MSKARVLADFISDGSTFADGAISVAEVSGAAPLASPTFTGTASGTFSGPLTGNVTGNVTGDVTGDVTGNITGNVTGNVTGDVAGEVDLSALAATISDTAVDVFVYDTRKDSDGGAWRKRTQHTSWYNETLNTATRGSRKEFPAVAVIVAESNTVTIYDGDDPDLPMWFVYDNISKMAAGSSSTGITAFNGSIVISRRNPTLEYRGGIIEMSFAADFMRWLRGNAVSNWWVGKPLTNRMDDFASDGSGTNLVDGRTNDVAMTVLPNAPIDAATGLPVPTIAVATNGGTSIIRDDGTVVDLTYTNFNVHGGVAFVDGNLLITNDNGSTNNRFQKIHTIPSSDLSAGTGYEAQQSSSEVVAFTGDRVLYDADFSYSYRYTNYTTDGRRIADNTKALGHTGGFVQYDGTRDTGVMFNNATSFFTTGYQVGDIKLATLSDTDDTDVTGSELVTNGDFSSALGAEWDLTTGSGTIAIVSGQLEITQGGYSSIMYAAQDFTTVAGKTYTLSFKVVATTEANYFRVKVGTSANATDLGVTSTLTAAGEYNITFTATGTTSWVTLHSDQNANKKTTWDNISVRLAEEDRSVNDNGLQVFGSITKTAVASGADLVAYSGWSGSNYLSQPYNSDLDLGTTDFCVMTWVKRGAPPSYAGIISYGNGDNTTNKGWLVRVSTSYRVEFRSDVTGGGSLIAPSGNALESTWTHVCFVRSGSTLSLYQNGKFVNSTTGYTADLEAGTSATLDIGTNVANDSLNVTTNSFVGSLALTRISATAPSPEQIAKIYEDEKVLFQENAQATLYGSSDAVTALAYDDSTNLLHVGTSAGRSVFQGLRRVDNTTTAVGAAISASNGLVADE